MLVLVASILGLILTLCMLSLYEHYTSSLLAQY